MDRPLKILFLMEDLCFGGTQRQNLQLAARLDRARFMPGMLTLTGPTDMDGIARDSGIGLEHLGRGRRVPPDFFVRLGWMLKKFSPDILVPCTALPNIWGRLWGALLGIPAVIGTCRGGGALKRQHERVLWRLCTRMVCNSPELRDGLLALGAPQDRVAMIANGVDTDFFRPGATPMARRAPEILCVARLAADKDHITLFRALELVLGRMPGATLRLVGDGPAGESLRRWAQGHAAGRSIIFTPAGTDMRPYLSAARVFALASLREGQPNAILEAMSAGLPVCATRVGGIPGLVEHGRTGFLCAPGDARALAENCLAILDRPDLGADMGASGREAAIRGFSYDVMVRSHERIFLEAYANGRAR